MDTPVSDELQTTVKMVLDSFPNGVSASSYRPLLGVLYPHMSHRQLAEVAHIVSGKPRYECLDDVFGVGESPPPAGDMEVVVEQLRPQGYQEWLLE